MRASPRRWLFAALIVLVLAAASAAAALVFPQPFFPHGRTSDMLVIASDRPLPGDVDRLIEDVRARVAAMDAPLPGARIRVFVCENERLYGLFTTLARRPRRTQAFVLSLPGNVFLNATHIRRAARSGSRAPRHWRFQGSIADAVAHELAHLSLASGLGSRDAARLPPWKAEGWADYQTHLAPIAADPAYSLDERIDLLLDEALWSGAAHERRLFGWQLMAEYAARVKGFKLRDLADASITEPVLRAEMLAWRRR